MFLSESWLFMLLSEIVVSVPLMDSVVSKPMKSVSSVLHEESTLSTVRSVWIMLATFFGVPLGEAFTELIDLTHWLQTNQKLPHLFEFAPY